MRWTMVAPTWLLMSSPTIGHAGGLELRRPLGVGGDEHRDGVDEADAGVEAGLGVVLLGLLGADRAGRRRARRPRRRAAPGPRRPARPATPRPPGGSTCRGRRASGPRSTGHAELGHVGELHRVVLAGEDGLADVEADLGGVDVERGDDLDVADVVPAEHDVHEARHGLVGVGVLVVLEALHQGAGAVPDAGDGETDGHGVLSSSRLGAAAGERGALVGDQLVEPGDVVLDGLGVVLPEGAQVAGPSGRRPCASRTPAGPLAGQAAGEGGPATLEELESPGGWQVATERHLEREGPVVGGRVLHEIDEQLLARLGETVRLPGPPGARRGRSRSARVRARKAAASPARDPVRGAVARRSAARPRTDGVHRAGRLEPGERRVQRAERHRGLQAGEVADALAQLVAVQVLLVEESEDGEVDHGGEVGDHGSPCAASAMYRLDISTAHPGPVQHLPMRFASRRCASDAAVLPPHDRAARTALPVTSGVMPPRRPLPSRRMAFEPSSLRGVGPGVVDHRLVRRALISEYRKGRLARHQVCDAHPELLRAARSIGQATQHGLPDLRGAQAGPRHLRVRAAPARPRALRHRHPRAAAAQPAGRAVRGLRRRGVPELLVAPPAAGAADRRPPGPAVRHRLTRATAAVPRAQRSRLARPPARGGSGSGRRSTSARRRPSPDGGRRLPRLGRGVDAVDGGSSSPSRPQLSHVPVTAPTLP